MPFVENKTGKSLYLHIIAVRFSSRPKNKRIVVGILIKSSSILIYFQISKGIKIHYLKFL